MSSHPSCVDRFVEEPTNVNENAAALQEPPPEGLLTDADLEGSPAKKRKVRKQVCTLMCMMAGFGDGVRRHTGEAAG